MAHIIYDNDQPGHHNSTGYNSNRSNGSYAVLAIVILFVLFFWADLGGLRANLGSRLRGNPNSRVTPVERPIINSITGIRYVTVDNLNMREQPASGAQAAIFCPEELTSRFLGNHTRNSMAMFGSK